MRTAEDASAPAGEPGAGTAVSNRSRTRDVVAVAIVAAAFLLPLRGLMRMPGPVMEEGFMLTFPERLLAGDIPNRDFLHLYGPGSLWVLAGVYRVLGTSLAVERLFGLLQQAGLVFGVFFIARWWGRRVAVVSALLAAVISLPPAGLTALAWTGGVALGLTGIAIGLHARATEHDRRATTLAALAGIAFGTAFLFRLDLVVAIVLAVAALTWRAPKRRVVALLAATCITGSLVLVQFVLAGFSNAFRGMVLEPVFDLRPGRRLPVPPSWGHLDGFLQRVGDLPTRIWWPLPTLPSSNQLFLWFFVNLAAIALVAGVGIWAIRRDPGSIRARAVLAAGLFSLGMVSQTLQRPDSTHVAWVSCVSIAFVPIALVQLLSTRGVPPRASRLASCGVPVLVVVLLFPNFSTRAYAEIVAQTFGHRRSAYAIEHNGRNFYFGSPAVADAANEMLPLLDRLIDPGDRLFVGPADLRRTAHSDAWLYYLLPEATPGTYYIEMDPGIANAPGSRLADDLRSSDVVVLSKVYKEWNEPNDSAEAGDGAATRVLRRKFCSVATFGDTFEVFQRCSRQPGGGTATQ